MRVLLAGGGTAGHTSPLLATAEVLKARGVEIVCLGTTQGLEATLIPQAGYQLEIVPRVPLPRKLGTPLLKVPAQLGSAVKVAGKILERVEPDVIVGFGGYVCVPAYLAGRRARIPLVVHEGNAKAGIANRLGARLTKQVATSFIDTDLPHQTYVGLPIRSEIAHLDRAASRDQARQYFGLDLDLPTLLVTGGSQGARSINEAVSRAHRQLADARIQVLHARGRNNEIELAPRAGDPPYVICEFIDRMDLAYAAADFIVCRSGANTVTEVAAVGLPAAFVPLPIGNGEQALNARAVVQAGGALLIEDTALSSAWVDQVLVKVVTDSDRLDAMSVAASQIVSADAADRLADMIIRAAR